MRTGDASSRLREARPWSGLECGTLKGWNNYGNTFIYGALAAVGGTVSLINPNPTTGAWASGLMTIRAPISGGGDLHVTGFKSVALDADNSGFSGAIHVTSGVTRYLRGDAYLDADSSFEGSPTKKGETLHCYSTLRGSADLRLLGSGTASFTTSLYADNADTFSGNVIVGSYATLSPEHTNALGSGPVSLAYPASVLQVRLNGTVAMSNDVSGLGSVRIGDSGTAAYGLTVQGATVDPGSAVTNGILRVEHVSGATSVADFAFAKNGDRNAAFVVDICGGQAVAGADHDQISLANGTAGGFANADLCVKIAPAVTEEDLAGDVLTIVKCAADLSAVPPFASVTFTEGWTGVVRYNADGTVAIEFIRKKGGTVLLVR